jgi:hypothetical protein
MWATEGARVQAVMTLLDTATVSTPATVSDETGGFTVTVFASVEDVPCRVALVTKRTAQVPARFADAAKHVIYFPWGTAVNPGDEIAVGGDTFPVLEVATSSMGLFTVAWCGHA